MSSGHKSNLPRRATAKPDYGVFDPDKFWGHALPGPPASTEPDSLDARVERAWRCMRNMFFTPEEHVAVAGAMVRLIGYDPAAPPRQPGREQAP